MEVSSDRDGPSARAAAVPRGKVAVIDGRRTITYGEVDERQRRIASFLSSQGLQEGDRVAVLAQNRAELLDVTSGSLRAGIIPVPVNVLLTAGEAAYILEDSGARWLFTDSRPELGPLLDGVITFGDAYERVLEETPPAQELGAFARTRPMHYTSGTTGWPKGVYVPVAGDAEASRRSLAFRSLWGIEEDDVHLVCSPLAHSAPHRYALRTLEAGGTVVLAPRFDPEEVLATIELFGVTSAFMVPAHLERILALGGRGRRYDLSSIRLLVHAGSPIREETKERVLRLFPEGSVWELYGSTEGGATRISSEEWRAKRGSVGKALPGAEVWVRDDRFQPLPPGEAGEVWVHDPEAERFRYWNDPTKTAAAWRAGAFSVGDLGWLDPDGYLYLTGRRDDTIITGGVNVYPQEVERVLGEHPELAEVVVYGWPNEDWGQEVRALVVPAPGMSPDTEAMSAWVRERLAHYKCPRLIEMTGALERTPTGKPKRPRAAP